MQHTGQGVSSIRCTTSFLVGFLSCLLLVGCAGFSYRYYGMQGVVYEHGMLLGPTERDDIPFSSCQPGVGIKNPCVVMLTKDYFAFKLDYEDLKQRLRTCERK